MQKSPSDNQSLLCQQCQTALKGRHDKKFCSVKCKNDFHYQMREHSDIVRKVDGILHKNRQILMQIFKDERKDQLRVPKILLDKMGFNFTYYTSSYLNSQQKRYYYLYDYAWMEFSMQELLLVRKKNAAEPNKNT